MSDSTEDQRLDGFVPFQDKWLGFLLVEGNFVLIDSDGLAGDIAPVPLSPDLKNHIRRWQAEFVAFTTTPAFDPLAGFDAYLRDGFVIARAIKAELPDWTIRYDDPFVSADLRGLCGFAELLADGTLVKPADPGRAAAEQPTSIDTSPEALIDEQRRFLAERFVTIAGDYTASGVWNKQGQCMDVDDLPISTALKRRIDAWQDWYNECDDLDQEDKPAPWAAFSAQGLDIAKAVKAELPTWTVEYVDENVLRQRCDSSGKRTTFRFVIAASGTPQPAQKIGA